MDSVSNYLASSPHETVLKPKDDGVSEHFAVRVPHLVVAYTSFKGYTQEDCIVRREDIDVFNSFRFYTLRFKLETTGWLRYYPVKGDPDESDLLGTVISNENLTVEPFSIHIRVVQASSNECHLHFSKPPFRVLQHVISGDILTINMEQEHVSSTGDKLCSFHGQKGVMYIVNQMPVLDGTVIPDLLVNPYSLFRMTPGQILEGIRFGGG